MAPSRGAKGPKVDTLPAERYRLLVRQLRDEFGGGHGWKEDAATRLGISGAFVGMIESGVRQAGDTSIAKARRRLKIHQDFFYEPSLGATPHYRDHLVSRAAEPAKEPEFWAEFIERYEHLEELSEDDLTEIKRFAGRKLRIRSWTDWERVAEMVRTAKPSPTFERSR